MTRLKWFRLLLAFLVGWMGNLYLNRSAMNQTRTQDEMLQAKYAACDAGRAAIHAVLHQLNDSLAKLSK